MSIGKEAKDIIIDKLISKPRPIEKRLQHIEDNISKNILQEGKVRFARLIAEIDRNFIPNTASRGYIDAFTALSFDNALELYFLGMNASLIVDLQGVLERFCFNALTDILPSDNLSELIISEMMEKRTLVDFAPYLKTLAIWDDDEVKFAKKITTLRNGIAHKNIKIVSKFLNDGKQNHYASIDSIMHKIDCLPYIIDTFKLLVKVSEVITSPLLKNPRLHARYNRYLGSIGMINCLFCFPNIIHLPRVEKELFLLEYFSSIKLLASETLQEKITKFQTAIPNFHDALGNNDNLAKNLYSELSEIALSIGQTMRDELKIDLGREALEIKPQIRVLEEIKKMKRN